jgi:hypothetical protein
MAAHIIDLVQLVCSKSDQVCVYYYCSYRQTEDQTDACLRWIVSQLCERAKMIPQNLVDLHSQNHQPSGPELYKLMRTLLPKLGRVYIIIDAVDECNNRPGLLDLLSSLATDSTFQNVRLLATSREYRDIDQILRPISEVRKQALKSVGFLST